MVCPAGESQEAEPPSPSVFTCATADTQKGGSGRVGGAFEGRVAPGKIGIVVLSGREREIRGFPADIRDSCSVDRNVKIVNPDTVTRQTPRRLKIGQKVRFLKEVQLLV